MEQCSEAWEQQFYMVFLDVKGDSTLFEQAVVQLCDSLRHSSLRVTLEQFRATRHFGKTALSLLAAGERIEVLKRKHAEAIKFWLANWTNHSDAAAKRHHQQSADSQSGYAFWEVYFLSQSKITWPDFIDALEDYYFPEKNNTNRSAERTACASEAHLWSASMQKGMVGHHKSIWQRAHFS